MTDEPDFIRRWSRRKQAARRSEQEPDVAPADEPDADPGGTAESDAADPTADSAASGPEALELPDIETLTAESDYSAFMKAGVPTELRNRALRKLWRVNPVFGHLDGLNDYDGDFTDAATVVKGLKTLYKVGRGFIREPAPETAVPSPDDAPAAEEADVIATAEPVEAPDDAEPAPDSGEAPESNKIT